jgi:hypothetical protein
MFRTSVRPHYNITVSKVHPRRFISCAAAEQTTGLTFSPFTEVQGELSIVESAPASHSYARVDFHDECEAALNEQINIEYTVRPRADSP